MDTEYVTDKQFAVLGGSDISTCVFASVITLLNDGLISQGKPVMGFLNPLLYSATTDVPILNDIISGNNPGCGTNGFFAKAGWDPITGLGSPNYPSLQRRTNRLCSTEPGLHRTGLVDPTAVSIYRAPVVTVHRF